MSKKFTTKREVRHRDVYWKEHFNLALEEAMRQVLGNLGDTIFNREFECLRFTDDVIIAADRLEASMKWIH